MYSKDWEVLALEPGASVAQIKSAFRRKVRESHPDVCPGDDTAEARLEAVVQAYQRLLREQETVDLAHRLFPDGPAPGEALLRNARPAPQKPDWRYGALLRNLRRGAQTLALIALLATPVVSAVLGGMIAHPWIVHTAEQHWESHKDPISPDERYAQALLYGKQNERPAPIRVSEER
ncbi:MAG: J domain-containing protein [Armatimonadetes bacterium]|nr:J domain-containing protein [Armatimonadota bacterium]